MGNKSSRAKGRDAKSARLDFVEKELHSVMSLVRDLYTANEEVEAIRQLVVRNPDIYHVVGARFSYYNPVYQMTNETATPVRRTVRYSTGTELSLRATSEISAKLSLGIPVGPVTVGSEVAASKETEQAKKSNTEDEEEMEITFEPRKRTVLLQKVYSYVILLGGLVPSRSANDYRYGKGKTLQNSMFNWRLARAEFLRHVHGDKKPYFHFLAQYAGRVGADEVESWGATEELDAVYSLEDFLGAILLLKGKCESEGIIVLDFHHSTNHIRLESFDDTATTEQQRPSRAVPAMGEEGVRRLRQKWDTDAQGVASSASTLSV